MTNAELKERVVARVEEWQADTGARLLCDIFAAPFGTPQGARDDLWQALAGLAARLVQEEREACAKVADETNQWVGDAIRARGKS